MVLSVNTTLKFTFFVVGLALILNQVYELVAHENLQISKLSLAQWDFQSVVLHVKPSMLHEFSVHA